MKKIAYMLIACALCLAACRRTPSGVISPGDMSRLLADMHVAESVADLNQPQYSSDSMRRVLKASVLEHHGVTQEKFDTSLVWYGHHLDVYIDVYDDVIERLEQRNRDLGTAIVQSAVNMAGDSVDVWPGQKYALFDDRSLSRYITFDIDRDDNWEKGDIYTWRLKLVDDDNLNVRWSIMAEYDDNTIECLTANTSNSDWNEVIFAGDSTRIPVSIRGYAEVRQPRGNSSLKSLSANKRTANPVIGVDSLSLIRKRLNPDGYRYHSRVRGHNQL